MGFIDELKAKPNNLRGMYASAQNVLIEGATMASRSCNARVACNPLIVHIDFERFKRLAGSASNCILFCVMRAIAQRVPHAAGTIGVMIEVPRSSRYQAGFRDPEERKAEMKMQANKPRYLPLWVAGIAAILVSGIAIGSLAISAQGFDGAFAPAEPPEAVAAPAIAAPGARASRCAECGVIESTREIEAPDEKTGVNAPGRIAAGSRGEIEGKPVRNYEITIRLQDGAMRVITDANPARWRHGERVTIIAGAD